MSISQNFPDEGPTLNLNFAGSKVLDPRITFSRSSSSGDATYMDANGLIVTAAADEPRFDHRYVNGEVESLGLLVEELRSNLLTYSDYSQGGSSANTSVTPNDTVSPDGTTNASSVDGANSNSNLKYLYKAYGTTTQGTYTFSVFAKYKSEQYIVIRINDNGGANDAQQRYDILNGTKSGNLGQGGTATNGSSTITPYPNGWYRLTVTCTFNSALTQIQSAIWLTGYQNTTTTNGVYLWGAQLEAEAFPTSYIPTTSSQATRTKDRAVIEGTNFTDIFDTNFESFSMFVNYDNLGITTGTNHAVVIFWGESVGYNDRIEFYKDDAAPYHIETRAFGGGSGVFANGNLSAGSTAATQKLAMSWSVPDYSDQPSRRWAFSFNGESVDVVNDGSGSTIPAVTRVGFGINPTRTDFHGKRITFKQITLYSNVLTDSQLQNLTK